MAALMLGSRSIGTVFDLLGAKENDLTYSVGWALAQSPTFLAALVQNVFHGSVASSDPQVRLQEYAADDGGFTDIAVTDLDFHLIVEAKRGC